MKRLLHGTGDRVLRGAVLSVMVFSEFGQVLMVVFAHFFWTILG
jgi:hypothetical protein